MIFPRVIIWTWHVSKLPNPACKAQVGTSTMSLTCNSPGRRHPQKVSVVCMVHAGYFLLPRILLVPSSDICNTVWLSLRYAFLSIKMSRGAGLAQAV
jgi:hypothetical protein